MIKALNLVLQITAAPGDSGQRLDKVVSPHAPEMSRTQVQEHIKSGRLSVNGRTVMEPGHKVKPGDAIRLETPPPRPADPQPEDIPLNVVYEDEHLIVIDKQAGLVVHPAPGARHGTLVNALIAHCGDSLSGIGGVMRPGIVHRLDKDTTGLMVVAKTDAAHHSLAAQFADHGRTGALERGYLALCWGAPKPQAGTVRTRIARHPIDRTRMSTPRTGGREAITHYKTIETLCCKADRAKSVDVSLVACTLETGRTHQVRVHMAYIGCPIVGDPVYGAGLQSKTRVLPQDAQSVIMQLNRQALHAETLTFQHPIKMKVIRFSSIPPADFLSVIKTLRSCHHKS